MAGIECLTRAPGLISMAQIIAALEGPIGMTECSSSPDTCEREAHCPARSPLQRLNHLMTKLLENVSLLEIAQPVTVPLNGVVPNPEPLNPQPLRI